MTKNSMNFHRWTWLLAAALLQLGTGVVFAQRQPAAAQAGFVSWKAPVKGDAGKYAGTKSCIEGDCHTSRVLQLSKTAHSHNDVIGMSTQTSCEACHGPGKEHTDREKEADRTKTKDPEAAKLVFSFQGSPQVNSAPCLACHRTNKEHDLYSRSEHSLQAVACNDCHEPHLVLKEGTQRKVGPSLPEAQFVALPKLPEERRWLNEGLLRQTQPELCVSCHRSVEGQFALPIRHRVLEGSMKCTDCHNTHGSLTKPLLQKATSYDTCVSCHADKRGPFVYEHASVKVEGCTICHTPHGSTNQHLVKRGESRFLCLGCHTQHGATSYQWSGSCTRCHVAIHGSNASQFFVK